MKEPKSNVLPFVPKVPAEKIAKALREQFSDKQVEDIKKELENEGD